MRLHFSLTKILGTDMSKAKELITLVNEAKSDGFTEITIQLKGDLASTFPEFIKKVSSVARGGHSFNITADEDDPFTVFIDGDGADVIQVK